MEIVNSVRARVGLVKRNPKIYEVKVSRRSSKRFLGRPAATHEDAIPTSTEDNNRNNNNNDDNASNNNSKHSRIEIPGNIEMAVFGQSRSAIPFSHEREVRTGVDKKLLKKILKSKLAMEQTEDLELHGTDLTKVEVINSKRMEQLRSRCPILKRLVLKNLNLCTERENRKLRVHDLPNDLEHFSIRESAFEPASFFADMDACIMRNLRVLDLSRSTLIEKGRRAPVAAWPRLENLKELYLEGVWQGRSASSLEDLLECFPNLEVLDLEGAELSQDDLVTIARLLPNLRELYLGKTGLRDAAMVRLAQSERSFEQLETICMCETDVRDIGLEYLMKSCPNLRSVTCRRSMVRQKEAEALEISTPGLKIARVEMKHIFSLFRDRCCDHYGSKYDRLASDVVRKYERSTPVLSIS